ncbi:MAG: ATP-binding protein [Sporichthyaceae bacterium]
MLPRQRHLEICRDLLASEPAVAILGARQVGKTTLAKQIAATWDGQTHYFDLESPSALARLADPELALSNLDGLIVLDEVHRRPEISSVLRVLIDTHPNQRYLMLGSASPHLLRQSSETLAGRIAFHDLTPFTLDEVGAAALDDLWVRGGFPRSFTAPDPATSFRRRLDFIRTFVERDLPSLGSQIPPLVTERFWRMLAHTHAQVWNSSRFASSFGVSDTTVRRYLDLLTGAMAVTQLQPWHENVGKRQVRAPKIYLSDSGVLHALLDLQDRAAIESHPILGASWEGFVIAQLAASTGTRPQQRFFWATHAGAELDLLIVRGTERIGFEIKRTSAPRMTASLRSAMETLRLDRAYVIYAGEHAFPMAERIEAVPAAHITNRSSW